jgi:hypothetical protein
LRQYARVRVRGADPDILRDDIRLVSVGERRLEGHDRPEEIYVVAHQEVELVGSVAEDEVLA